MSRHKSFGHQSDASFSGWRWLGAVLLGAGLVHAYRSAVKVAPPVVAPVRDFDLNRYMGDWYEVARLDNAGQKGLMHCRATYALKEDGSVQVTKRAFHTSSGKWRQSEGSAKFVGESSVGALMLSFFGPFYSGYNVVALDADYQMAMVMGEGLDQFWILSRQPQVPAGAIQVMLDLASVLGVDVSRVIQPQGSLGAELLERAA